jgi:hypothetical protein
MPFVLPIQVLSAEAKSDCGPRIVDPCFWQRRLSGCTLGSTRQKDCTGAIGSTRSQRSRHLFQADNDMATAVYDRAALFGSVMFFGRGRARSALGQSPLPKSTNLQHQARRIVAATENRPTQSPLLNGLSFSTSSG